MASETQISDMESGASNSKEVCLHIDDQDFIVKKDVLCEHSDYFRAMFSGNYVEQNKDDITIDVVDSQSMDIILRYMTIGLVDLSEFSLPVIGHLAMAANFLQVTELRKQIEYCLDIQLSISNWLETMILAENASYTKLQQTAEIFGLLSFNNMKPEYIPNIKRLFWYLSHPSLNADSEFDVFKFGYKWVLHPATCPCADILLIILGCLDVRRLTVQDLKEIIILMTNCENSLATKVVECLKLILDNKLEVSTKVILANRFTLSESFTQNVVNEVFNMVFASKARWLLYTPVVPIWAYTDGKLELTPHYMYTFDEMRGEFKKWLEVAEKNLWGWNVATWGPNKLVQVCGEHGRGTGQFMKDVKVYDTLRKEWICHGVQLPARRHAGVTIAGDSLFIIGGVGGFRVLQDTAFIYDLKLRTFRKIVDFPDAIQSPAICTHYGTVYAAGFKNIYKYEDLDEVDKWITILSTNIRPNRMVSFKEYLYCSQNYFSNMYRFRPGIDKQLEIVTQFSAPPAAYCNLGNRLLIFTKPACGQSNELKVEEYRGPCMCPDGTCPKHVGCWPKILWADKASDITVNDVAGACSLVMDLPKKDFPISSYHQRYLSRYADLTYEK